MKISLIGFILLLATVLFAGQTNSTATASASGTAVHKPAFEAQTAGGNINTFILREPKPNEIIHGKATYDGIGIELYKTHRPLQLVNPLAPARYGSPDDNIVRDPINGRVTGLKFLSIRF